MEVQSNMTGQPVKLLPWRCRSGLEEGFATRHVDERVHVVLSKHMGHVLSNRYQYLCVVLNTISQEFVTVSQDGWVLV